ncbi:GAF domain-containing protein [Chromatium okenii]|uniref:GAF domain-containing protein n=1 Tax=Chromatium okenii TaxID=61644 RepID=UPI0026EF2296|nr:GAF domain-containing protein [Chromatium okenii]MBV5308488.1 GAF domain-containing protein [Chromatium okenii]
MTPEIAATHPLVHEFTETLAVCGKLLDALYLVIRTTSSLGIPRAALCLPDPAIDDKLVVRLSLGMAGASNKVLAPSAPGTVAAFQAYTSGHTLWVKNYAASSYQATDLEEYLRISGAVHIPLSAAADHFPLTSGLLIAVPRIFDDTTPAVIAVLEHICRIFAEHLPRLAPIPAFPERTTAEQLPWQTELFTALHACLNTSNIEELSHLTLDHCRTLTGSEFGFVGYRDPATGFLVTPTMTRNIFAQCQVAGKTVVFEKPSGLGGWVLDNRFPIIANDPFSHPASVGTPPGHLPIRKFMGVPCVSQGQLMGMIALANKDSDYNHQDLSIVQAFADIYGAAVARFLSERELVESRNRLISLYENAPCGYHTITPDGRIIEMNETALALLGRTREDTIDQLNVNDLLTTKGQALLAEQIQALKRGAAAPIELHFTRTDGSRLPVLHSVTQITDQRGFTQMIRCTSVDLRQRQHAEERIRSLNRIYAVLSGINGAIVRLREPAALYQEACRIAVEVGGFRMAWLGLADAVNGEIRLSAQAGAVDGYLDHLHISLNEDEQGCGPTGVALRQGQHVVCNDIAADPRMKPWRDAALALGYRASAAFPIRVAGQVLGVFNLYADTAEFFDTTELNLLDELTQDIGFAMESMENERQRKQTETALQQQKDILDRTSRLAQVGGWEFDVATGSGFWTAETMRIIGVTPDVSATMSAGLTMFHGEMRQRLERALDTAIKHAQPYELELEITTSAGSHKWIRTVGQPIVENGRVVRMEGAIQDISSRKHAQLRARQSEILLDSVFQVLPDLFFLIDPDSTIRDYRASRDADLYVSPAVFLGKRISEVLPLEVAQQFDDSIALVLVHGKLVTYEYSLLMSNGLRHFESRINRLPGTAQLIAVVRDITERKHAETALSQLNAELEQRVTQRTTEIAAVNAELETFTYSVSHDLKAPLRGIDGYSRLLLEDHLQQLDEEGRLFLHNVRHGVEQMGQLIEDLLAYSRMERRNLRGVALNVHDLLTRIIAERTADIDARHGRVVMDFDPLALVSADPDGLALVLRNLLDNALKFSGLDTPPLITITAETGEQSLILAIQDNGIGFDMQFHDRIFEIFQRLQRAEDYPGTGIGLAIVRKAMQRMGGRIWAQSVRGEGTTFFVELPSGGNIKAQ